MFRLRCTFHGFPSSSRFREATVCMGVVPHGIGDANQLQTILTPTNALTCTCIVCGGRVKYNVLWLISTEVISLLFPETASKVRLRPDVWCDFS